MNILFLCTGNSCRSILAEATFNHLARQQNLPFLATSAGSRPTGFVHPRSLLLLQSLGINTDGYTSKSWDNLPAVPNIVITVCGNAVKDSEQDDCPFYMGDINTLRAHWGVADPAHVTGDEETINAAFRTAQQILAHRIHLSMPHLRAAYLPNPTLDKKSLQKLLGDIGNALPNTNGSD